MIVVFFQVNDYLILISHTDLSRAVIYAHRTDTKTDSRSDYVRLSVLKQSTKVGFDLRSRNG